MQYSNIRWQLSASGQERHFGRPDPMSALPPLATAIATCRAIMGASEADGLFEPSTLSATNGCSRPGLATMAAIKKGRPLSLLLFLNLPYFPGRLSAGTRVRDPYRGSGLGSEAIMALTPRPSASDGLGAEAIPPTSCGPSQRANRAAGLRVPMTVGFRR